MALRAVTTAVRSVAAVRVVAAAPARFMSDKMRDRERAAEKAYFNKQDEQLLRKLLNKVKDQADTSDIAAPKVADTELSKLKAIVSKYDMSDEDIHAIIAWRHADDH